jgi:hypothetical protein
MFFNKNPDCSQEHLQYKVTSIEANNSIVHLNTNGVQAASYISNILYGYQHASAVDEGTVIDFDFKLNDNTIILQGSNKMLTIVFSLLNANNLLAQQSIDQLNQQESRYSIRYF